MRSSTASRSPTPPSSPPPRSSNRYITDRFLPDKAIDLIDEACAMIRTEMDSMPTELDVIHRKIIQMEIEEAALQERGRRAVARRVWPSCRRSWPSSARPVQRHEGQVGKRKERHRPRAAAARADRTASTRDIEHAEQSYDLEKAAKLKYGDLPEAQEAAGGGGTAGAERARSTACCATRSPRRRSPGSSSAGPASRWRA